MKQIILIILAAAAFWVLTACEASGGDPATEDIGSTPPAQQGESGAAPDGPDRAEDTAPEQAASDTVITLTVGGQTFFATLLENETARQLAARLPLTLDMSELNGNEKYFYMDEDLPTDSCQPGQINAGDLMLYGNNCLVLFYESFSSGYSYTRLGSLDDPSGLVEALGAGNAEVTFSMGGE